MKGNNWAAPWGTCYCMSLEVDGVLQEVLTDADFNHTAFLRTKMMQTFEASFIFCIKFKVKKKNSLAFEVYRFIFRFKCSDPETTCVAKSELSLSQASHCESFETNVSHGHLTSRSTLSHLQKHNKDTQTLLYSVKVLSGKWENGSNHRHLKNNFKNVIAFFYLIPIFPHRHRVGRWKTRDKE